MSEAVLEEQRKRLGLIEPNKFQLLADLRNSSVKVTLCLLSRTMSLDQILVNTNAITPILKGTKDVCETKRDNYHSTLTCQGCKDRILVEPLS